MKKVELAVKSHHPARYVGIYRQTQSKEQVHARWLGMMLGILLTLPSLAGESTAPRYIRLDSSGKVVTEASNDAAASCIEDRSTGLFWELKTNDAGWRDARHTYAWHAVPHDVTVARCGSADCNVPAYIAAVNAAGLCGATDWRLPAREELRSIVDYSRAYPGPTIDTAIFNPTAANFYWSLNEDASDRRNAWGIGFAFGFDYAYPKENAAHVRLVRRTGNTVQMRFVTLPDGTVRNTEQSLVWQRCSDGQRWNGTACAGNATRLTYAEALSRQQAPWRLPTLTELTGLVDTTRYAAAVNDAAFPNTAAVSYWSDTPLAGRPAMMWLVNFLYGDSFADSMEERAAVRWMRNDK